MSLDTFDSLKEQIKEWSHREDVDLRLNDFVQLAETEMYANTVENLKIRDGETLVAFSTNTTDRFAALPAEFQEMRKMRIQIVNGESVEIRYRTPSQLQILSSTGLPLFFTVTDQIEFERVSDQIYSGEIQYFQEFTALSDANPTNTVLTNNPNIYLFGGLWALKKWAEEPGESAAYYQDFINAIRGANNKSKEGRYGPAPVMRVEGYCP